VHESKRPFRVAHLISAARPGVPPATHFRSQGRKLMLVFEHQMVDLVADRVGSRFKQLARLVGPLRVDRAALACCSTCILFGVVLMYFPN